MSVFTELREAREERANVWEQMKAINDAAEGREFTAEETQKWGDLEKRYVELAGEDGRGGLVAELERRARILNDDPERPSERDRVLGGSSRSGGGNREDDEPRSYDSYQAFLDGEGRGRPNASPEYRMAFFHALAGGLTQRAIDALPDDEQRLLNRVRGGGVDDPEFRSLSTLTGPEGGILVPTTTEARIRERAQLFSPLLELCDILVTGSGEELDLPIEAAIGEAGDVAENTDYPEEDVVLALATLRAFKSATSVFAPRELLTDAVVDMESYLVRKVGQRIGIRRQKRYAQGRPAMNGQGAANGIYAQLTVGHTTAVSAQAKIGGDDVIDGYYSIRAPYRQNATWVGTDQAIKSLRKAKDNNGQYLWSPGLRDGEADTLFTKPVRVDEFMPAFAPATVALAFGDWEQGVTIREVAGVYVQRLVELRALKGQIGWLADQRHDIALIDPNAVKAIKTGAAA